MSEASKMRAPNDWKIGACLTLSGSLLLAVWGLIGLGALGLDIPVLRQIVVFIFLSFVPGLLLLRILRIHNVHIIESLLYSVGLSLAFVMATGVVANFALPPLGISRPIALLPLLLIITLALLLLCLLAYIRDKDFRPSSQSDSQTLEPGGQSFWAKLSPYLLAILLPLLAILGANLVNAYYNDTLIFALIFVIAIIIGLVAFNKFIPPSVYPFMIFMMALALLYQTTFISNYLVGSDIHFEYYFAKLVVGSGYWDATIHNAVTACLSITMLAPVYWLLLNMDAVWLFKIIYPFLFCLVPLALYRIYRLQFGPRHAFFAAFFFIAMPMFTMDMAQLARQQISELFFVLVILLLVDRKLSLTQKAILAIIFSLGGSVTYYGMGPILTGYLILCWLVLSLIKSRPGRNLWRWVTGKRSALPADLTSSGAFTSKAMWGIIGVFLVGTLTYYFVTASGQTIGGFNVLTNILKSTAQQIGTPPPTPTTVELPGFILNIIDRFPFLNPLARESLAQTAIGLDFAIASPWGKIWRVFQYLVEIFIVVGFLRLVFQPRGMKVKMEFLSMVLISGLVLAGVYFSTASSYGMGVTRVFHITLFFLSPLFLLGGELIVYGIINLVRVFRRRISASWLNLDNPALLRFPVLFVLIPYFIFNSGTVFELSRSQTSNFIDTPYSISLSGHRVELTTISNRQDIVAAEWIFAVRNKEYQILADHHVGWFGAQFGAETIAGKRPLNQYFYLSEEIPSPSYIYLRTRNIQERELAFNVSYAARQSVSFDDLPSFALAIIKSDRIYNNGSAQVLLHR